MKIDAHQHYWSIDRGDYGWITPQITSLYRDYLPSDLEPHLYHHKFEGSILVQAAPTLEESKYILQLANQHPSIFGVVGWVDFLNGDPISQFTELKQQSSKLVGVRIMLQDMVDESQLLHPDVLNKIDYFVQQDIPLDLLVVSNQLNTVISLLNKMPSMKAVIDHIGKPNIRNGEYEEWARAMLEISHFENVFCKISGMVTEADHQNWSKEQFIPYIKQIIKWFGTYRVMFGSDWPVCLLAASYDEVVDIVESALPQRLSIHERKLLFGLNAAKFYNVGGPYGI